MPTPLGDAGRSVQHRHHPQYLAPLGPCQPHRPLHAHACTRGSPQCSDGFTQRQPRPRPRPRPRPAMQPIPHPAHVGGVGGRAPVWDRGTAPRPAPHMPSCLCRRPTGGCGAWGGCRTPTTGCTGPPAPRRRAGGSTAGARPCRVHAPLPLPLPLPLQTAGGGQGTGDGRHVRGPRAPTGPLPVQGRKLQRRVQRAPQPPGPSAAVADGADQGRGSTGWGGSSTAASVAASACSRRCRAAAPAPASTGACCCPPCVHRQPGPDGAACSAWTIHNPGGWHRGGWRVVPGAQQGGAVVLGHRHNAVLLGQHRPGHGAALPRCEERGSAGGGRGWAAGPGGGRGAAAVSRGGRGPRS